MEKLNSEKLSNMIKVIVSQWELGPKIGWLFVCRQRLILLLRHMLNVVKSLIIMLHQCIYNHHYYYFFLFICTYMQPDIIYFKNGTKKFSINFKKIFTIFQSFTQWLYFLTVSHICQFARGIQKLSKLHI